MSGYVTKRGDLQYNVPVPGSRKTKTVESVRNNVHIHHDEQHVVVRLYSTSSSSTL